MSTDKRKFNAIIRRHNRIPPRQGLGYPVEQHDDFDFDDFPSTPPFNPTNSGNVGITDAASPLWALLAGVTRTVGNIFQPAAVGVAQAYAGQPRQQIYQQSQYPQQQQQGSGIGLGIDGQGIRLSDGSHIGWLPIVAVVGGFMLLQARPVSRR